VFFFFFARTGPQHRCVDGDGRACTFGGNWSGHWLLGIAIEKHGGTSDLGLAFTVCVLVAAALCAATALCAAAFYAALSD